MSAYLAPRPWYDLEHEGEIVAEAEGIENARFAARLLVTEGYEAIDIRPASGGVLTERATLCSRSGSPIVRGNDATGAWR